MRDAKKIWEAWGKGNALYSAWASDRNINSYQLFVLYAIEEHEAITQKTIAETTGLSKQTVNTVIRALKRDGYVELTDGNVDRREKLVSLTSKGVEYSAKLLEPLHEVENRVFELIGEDRVKDMMNFIQLFNTVFEKEMEYKRK